MSTSTLQASIDKAAELIKEADYILIGAGSGLSASAGLDYASKEIFDEKYIPFRNRGYKGIWDAVVNHWSVNEDNKLTYWGFWCHHIHNIFYAPDALAAYRNLYDLVKDKNHFVITTNVDHQFYKSGFEADRIFSMQGSYGLLQCSKPCSEEVYDNEEAVKKMLEGFNSETLEIRTEDVPYCPNCGRLLHMNLRADDTFIEKPHVVNMDKYLDFVEQNQNVKLVLLELGVGFNTPVIIRFPFERLTYQSDNTTLVRVNMTQASIRKELEGKSLSIEGDIGEFIEGVLRQV